MAMCLNRITMNIIKDKCIGNRNLECIGLAKSYEEYEIMYCALSDAQQRSNMLSKEDYVFVKTWSNKKPRAKTKEVK